MARPLGALRRGQSPSGRQRSRHLPLSSAFPQRDPGSTASCHSSTRRVGGDWTRERGCGHTAPCHMFSLALVLGRSKRVTTDKMIREAVD